MHRGKPASRRQTPKSDWRPREQQAAAMEGERRRSHRIEDPPFGGADRSRSSMEAFGSQLGAPNTGGHEERGAAQG
eukprot:8967963-Pyramimonas_sp.AAC.1